MNEKEQFGAFLYRLRTSCIPKKIAQTKLSNVMGISRQYLDAIEKGSHQASPPNLAQCLAIIDTLNLNTDDAYHLLWLAFKGRIRRDLDFFEYLQKLPAPTPQSAEHSNEISKTVLRWSVSSPSIKLSKEIQKELYNEIETHLFAQKWTAQSINVTDQHVDIQIIGKVADADILIQGLKSATERRIKKIDPFLVNIDIWNADNNIVSGHTSFSQTESTTKNIAPILIG
jgi:DNA-binding XRE family transcriptional regulator